MTARHSAITTTDGMKRDNKVLTKTDRLLFLVLIGALCIENPYYATPAKAQFAVQPMVLSLKSKPGTQIKTEIRLQNLQQNSTQQYLQFEIQPIDLIQSPDGQWLPIGPAYPDSADPVTPPKHASCRAWIYQGIGFYETGATESFDVTINVPAEAQGFFCAAFLITIKNPFENTGIITDYEFIVPVMVKVEGPAPDRAVRLKDAGLAQDTAAPAPSTLVTLEVENQGHTFSQLTGFAHVFAYEGDQLGPIKHKITFDEAKIIPGSRLKLKKALPELLPLGRYRVLDDLSVDNRLVAGISRDIELADMATNPPKPNQPTVPQSRANKPSSNVSHFLLQISEPDAPVSQTIHYAIKSPEPTVAIMKQKPVRVSQDGSACDPYHTYSGSRPIEFFTNAPVRLQASAVATSLAEGNWTCATDPDSICGHMNATLFVRATDVQLKNLPTGGVKNLEVARITVQVIPRL